MKFRTLALVLSLMLPIAAFSKVQLKPLECKLDNDPESFWLYEVEVAAEKKSLVATPDAVADEFAWQKARKFSDDGRPNFGKGKAHPISWDQAKVMILRGYVSTIFQGHDRSIEIVTNRGTRFSTREDELDEIYIVASNVDPCHRYIEIITE